MVPVEDHFTLTGPEGEVSLVDLFHGRRFADALDVGERFAVNVFIRDDNKHVYRTYFTTDRGAELFDTNFRLLDLTPSGRQETWEDSPEGWPQSPPFEWWCLHDEYDT